MSIYDRFYHRMPDGTIKQINPFSNTEVWCVPERGKRPAIMTPPAEPVALEPQEPENYCHFCSSQYMNTPPEKARVYRDEKGKWKKDYYTKPEDYAKQEADFRRVGNLFEIVTFDYWDKNYGYEINTENKRWQDSFIGSTGGFKHTMNVLQLKLARMGMDFDAMSIEERIERSAPFFGGCHELIIGKRHFKKGARFEYELCSSGLLSEEEHYIYTKFTIETIEDIHRQNPFIRYVSVFQNWLKEAGASFDHLHRQLVGLDEWGVQAHREISELRVNPNLYNELAANYAIYNSLLIAENDFAIAFSEIGHRFPSVAVYSKSPHSRPFAHSDDEIRGMSELLHAIHVAITENTSCNEEWFFAPFDSTYTMPWHILLKLRLHVPAGFEGNTKIYINPISPKKLRHDLVEAMIEKRDDGLIPAHVRIGDEVNRTPNPLKYYQGNMKDRVIP